MSNLSSRLVLQEVEEAINERNYGRMYDLGVKLVKESANDNCWLEAAVIISGYLVKSPANVWNAIDLSKRAALAAPEQTRFMEMTSKCLISCINELTEPQERVEAAYSVVAVAPSGSILMVICLELMLDNVPGVVDIKERKRYIKIVINYSPEDSTLTARAEVLMKEANQKKPANKNKSKDNTPLLGFLNRHQNNVAELFNAKKKEKPT